MVRGLEVLQPLLEFGVGGEVDGLVCALTEGGEGHAAVQGADTFFAEDGEEAVHGVAVFGDVERIGEGVVLRLQADFDDLHGRDDGDSFGDACAEAGWEGRFSLGRFILGIGGGGG